MLERLLRKLASPQTAPEHPQSLQEEALSSGRHQLVGTSLLRQLQRRRLCSSSPLPPPQASLTHTAKRRSAASRLGSRSRSTTCERMHANEDATTLEPKRSTRHCCTITAPRTCVARAASDWAWQQTGRPVPRAPGRRRRRRGEPSRDGGEIVASIIRFDEPCQLSVSTSAPPQLGAIY